jgi:hypothetical protein
MWVCDNAIGGSARSMSTHGDPADPEHPSAPVHTEEHAVEEHGHDEPVVGPFDVPAWAAAIGGVLIGIAVAFCFALATAPT